MILSQCTNIAGLPQRTDKEFAGITIYEELLYLYLKYKFPLILNYVFV